MYRKTNDYLDRTDLIRKCRLNKNSNVDIVMTTLAGAFAGVLSWVCVIPFDVVKTIMQAEQNAKYRSIYHCITMNFKVRII